jgi:hypothetical protein
MLAMVDGSWGHAVTCHKVVERGVRRYAYLYDNNDGATGFLTTPKVAVFHSADNNYAFRAEETLDFRYYGQHTADYPHGFPCDFGTSQPYRFVIARQPRVAPGDFARAILAEILRALGGIVVGEREFLLTLACPVRGLVTDSHGRRIGFVGDTLVQEIPGATIDTGFDVAAFHLPDSLQYTLTTAAFDTGRMEISLVLPAGDSAMRAVRFDTLKILSPTRTTLSFLLGDTTFPLAVDWDGNGPRDTTLYPNFNDTLSLRAAGIAERQPQLLPVAGNLLLNATVVRGALWLGGGKLAVLTDITGRKVAVLHPGENNLRRLAPGVYFVTDRDGRTLHRIVLQK